MPAIADPSLADLLPSGTSDPTRPARSPRRWRRFLVLSLGLSMAVGLAGAFFFATGVAGERDAAALVGRVDLADLPTDPAQAPSDADARPKAPGVLRVMSLNLAHGRGTALHQLLVGREQTKSNLDACAAVIRRETPDLVALQEADGPSAWSGDFDHVQHLAAAARRPWFVRGEHVSGFSLSYGTALISTCELSGAAAHTFEPTPPTLTKGYVVATLPWPGREGVLVDVVSVHLDFARERSRAAQIEEMIAGLQPRARPLVVIGDLNCDFAPGSPARRLAEALDLQAFAPEAPDLITFPTLERRLDWVLISRDLAFVEHRILPEPISDHRAVVADLRLVADLR